jgi:carboxymethylenebutenolidase
MTIHRKIGIVTEGTRMLEHDLAALWDAHCRHEFETRDGGATIATMAASPYVNHIPTIAVGISDDQLKRFHTHHFIGANPLDITMIPVKASVGS